RPARYTLFPYTTLFRSQEKVRPLPADAWPLPSLAEMGEISLGDYLRQQGASPDAILYLSQGFESDSLLDFVHDSVSHAVPMMWRSEEHTSELQSLRHLV